VDCDYLLLFFTDVTYSSVYFDMKQQKFVNKVHSSVQGDGHLLLPPLQYIADSLYIRLLYIIANVGDEPPALQFLKCVCVCVCVWCVLFLVYSLYCVHIVGVYEV